jgi:hypothetical protein
MLLMELERIWIWKIPLWCHIYKPDLDFIKHQVDVISRNGNTGSPYFRIFLKMICGNVKMIIIG